MTDHKNPDPPTRSKSVPSDASPQADAPVSPQLGDRSKPVTGPLGPSLTKRDSLPRDVGLFWAKSGDSLAAEIGPVGDLPYIESLWQVDAGKLTAVQRETYRKLDDLAHSTRLKYEHRFSRYVRGDDIQAPRTRRGRSALLSALKCGYLLNTLHPDPGVAECWVDLLSEPIDLPNGCYVEVNEHGSINFVDPIGKTTHRRDRLKKLDRDFITRSIAAAATSTTLLRNAFIVMALTGSRPGEVASCSWELDDATATLRLFLQTNKVKATDEPRTRCLTLSHEASELGQFVGPLSSFLQNSGDAYPFEKVSARSIENLCTRLSARLWPKVLPGLNSSCFRCRFIADCKADGIAREVIAALVGHEDLSTAKHYGVFSQGGRGHRTYLQTQRSGPSEQPLKTERDWY